MSLNCGGVPQMLVLIASFLLGLLLQGPRVQGYEDYDDISEEGDEDDYINYDVVDEEAPVTSTTAKDDEELKSNRIRRDQDEEAAVDTKTLSPEDLGEVKGALNQILSRISADNPFTPHSTTPSIDYNYYYTPTTTLIDLTTTITSTTPSYTVEEISTQTEDLINGSGTTSEEETVTSASIRQASDDNYNEDWPTRSSKIVHEIKNNLDRNSSIKVLKQGELIPEIFPITAMTAGTPQQIDIGQLLGIISELAEDFETNLTRKLNESIAGMGIPTCTTPTPPTTTLLTTVMDEYDANYTGAVVAKCFVCGLDIPGIPQHAHCADAFAGDFLPLVPVDTSAKGKISRFRKYCKYANIRGYRTKSQSRVIIGRWTGGCAVRWVDLSGVYTQRTCRNRMQPTMGLHYASKRMAKLEKALWNLEDGCIASPVATLTPLSRAVSLYARFHACVCSGSWCNAARVRAPSPSARRLVLYTTLISGLGATWPV